MKQYNSKKYWNLAAKKFGKSYQGLKAICLVGMDDYYNKYCDSLQKRETPATMCVRTPKEWIEIFKKFSCKLIRQRGTQVAPFRSYIINLGLQYYDLLADTYGKKEETDNLYNFPKVCYYSKSSLKRLYDYFMKIAIFMSKPFDYYLSQFKFFWRFSIYRVFLFKKV